MFKKKKWWTHSYHLPQSHWLSSGPGPFLVVGSQPSVSSVKCNPQPQATHTPLWQPYWNLSFEGENRIYIHTRAHYLGSVMTGKMKFQNRDLLSPLPVSYTLFFPVKLLVHWCATCCHVPSKSCVLFWLTDALTMFLLPANQEPTAFDAFGWLCVSVDSKGPEVNGDRRAITGRSFQSESPKERAAGEMEFICAMGEKKYLPVFGIRWD